jgi:AcrR family transcriptional regulator
MDASLPVDAAAPVSPPRPRLTSFERRQAIIDAALSLFSEKGFRGVTTRELASAVGVTEPVLYQHFKTKSDLFRALVETQCQIPEAELELQPYIEAGDDYAFFRHLAMGILTWYLDDTRFPKLLLHSALDRHELADLFYETQVSRFYQMIEAHIAARIRAGAFRDIDPTLAARAFVGMVGHQGMIGAVYAPDKVLPPRQEMVEQLVNIFLSGLKLNNQTDQKEEKE